MFDERSDQLSTFLTVKSGDPASELAYYPEDPEAEAGRKALIEELEFLREETKDQMYGATTASF